MKRVKRVLALLAAFALVLAMAVPAWAASITINGTGKTYKAYKLLNATVSGTGEGKKISYTVNEKYAKVLKAATSATDEKGIIKAIEGKTEATAIRSFANDIYAKIKAGEIAEDYTSTGKTFANVDKGYYLIVETELNDEADTYSLVMLNTADQDNVTVTSKEDSPTFEKKIKEKNDSTGVESGWQDGADYDINDVVPFKLQGTVPQNYGAYNTYKYVFHDKMSSGLTFDASSVVVKVNETAINSGYSVVTESLKDDCTFEVQFENLKDIPEVTAGCTITVEYNATLNDKAVIGSAGNPNEAKLEYSNNPYGNGTGTGETPWDKVIAFTYQLVANKVDKDGEPVKGAGFTLYKWSNEGDKYVAVSSEITGVTKFNFKGIDAGQYKLVESKVPDGYTKAEDLVFTVVATYDTDNNDPKFGTLTIKDGDKVISDGEDKVFTVNLVAGSFTTKVVNLTGTTLPSTGGMGTTVFYVVGGGLMAVAVVLLVTKKRMENKR